MSFPLNPINGQTTTTNNITYIYSSSNTAWTRVPTTLTLNTGSSSGGTAASGTGTTSTFVIQNTTQSTGTNSGALQVYGGAGIGGNLYVGGNIVGGGVRSTTTSTQPTTATVGDIWYLQGTDIVYRYEFDGTNSYWIDFNGPTVLVSGTGTVSGGTGGTSSVFNGGTVTNTTTFLTPIIIGTGTTTATQVSLAVLGTDAIQMPVGTTAQRPANPAVGMIRYNTSGTLGLEVFVSAAGTGTNPSIGTWTSIVAPIYTVNYLIVAGGGGGGETIGGGGGAGGMITGTTTLIAGVQYPIVVGGGGTGDPASGNPSYITDYGGNGGNTTALGYTAFGGGGGGGYDQPVSYAQSGGSGGGTGSGASGNAAGTPGQGNQGGSAGSNTNSGAGGGGAGAAGGNAVSGTEGTGGIGKLSAIYSGTNVYYAGGGGGGSRSNAPTNGGGGGAGGLGGGGAGQNGNGINGTPYTGGGGGGGGYANPSTSYAGGNGGSGIVIISYANANQRASGGVVTSYQSGSTLMWVHTFTTSSYYTA